MTVYNLVLFAHVVGAIGYCISIGAWLLALVGLRRARRVEEARALIHVNTLSAPIGAVSALLILAAGPYLALTAWSLLTSWILVALISLLVMVPSSAVLIAPRRGAIVKLLEREAPAGEISPALKQRLRDPVLFGVVQTGAVLLLGLIFLMTTKPDLLVSILTMLVALLLGLALSALGARAGHPQRGGRAVHDGRASALVS
jgi:Predicted integral membrane protein (DUF2269)